MPTYFVYGVTFSSTIVFQSPLPLSDARATLHVTEQHSTLPVSGLPPLSTLTEEYWDRAAPQAIYRVGGTDILQFPLGDQILVGPDTIIYSHGGEHGVQPDLMDVRLLGSGFAWWCLKTGRIPFHAGAVVVDGEAVLFSAESQTGKSSLMCSLLARQVPLLCDDFVAVHLEQGQKVVASSAYPQMRLWPSAVRHFVGNPDSYPPIIAEHSKRRVRVAKPWGNFLVGTFPLSRIYLLTRQTSSEASIDVRQLQGHESFMALLSSVTLGSLLPVSDAHALLSLVQQIAWHVPVYRLSYPTGWQWLAQIQQAVFEPTSFFVPNTEAAQRN